MQCQDAIPCDVISALLPACAIDCAPPKPPQPKKPGPCVGPQCFSLPPPGFPPPTPGQGGFFISTCPPCADGSIPSPPDCPCAGIVTGCGDSCGSNYCSTRYQACIGDCIQGNNARCDPSLHQLPYPTDCHAQVCGNQPCPTAGKSIACQACCINVIGNCVNGGGHPCGGGQPIIFEIPPGPETCTAPSYSPDSMGNCLPGDVTIVSGSGQTAVACCFPQAQPVLELPQQPGGGGQAQQGPLTQAGVLPTFLPESDWLAYLQAFPQAFSSRGYDAN